jgi:hypothetical protein
MGDERRVVCLRLWTYYEAYQSLVDGMNLRPDANGLIGIYYTSCGIGTVPPNALHIAESYPRNWMRRTGQPELLPRRALHPSEWRLVVSWTVPVLGAVYEERRPDDPA